MTLPPPFFQTQLPRRLPEGSPSPAFCPRHRSSDGSLRSAFWWQRLLWGFMSCERKGSGSLRCELCPTEGPLSGEGMSFGWLPYLRHGGLCVPPALSLHPSLWKGSLWPPPQPKAHPAHGRELAEWGQASCLAPEHSQFLQQSPEGMARSGSCLEPPSALGSRSL